MSAAPENQAPAETPAAPRKQYRRTLLPWAALVLMFAALLYGLAAQRRIAEFRRRARQADRRIRELRPLEEAWRNYARFEQELRADPDRRPDPPPFSLAALPPPERAETNRTAIASGVSAETISLSWDRASLARLAEEINALERRRPFSRLAALRIDPSFRSDRARIRMDVETIIMERDESTAPGESRAGN